MLGGLKQYAAAYVERREVRRAASQLRVAREREESQRSAYAEYRRRAALDLFATLPETEQAVIEGLVIQQWPTRSSRQGSLATTIFQLAKARITAERHPDRIQTLEQWRAKRQRLH